MSIYRITLSAFFTDQFCIIRFSFMQNRTTTVFCHYNINIVRNTVDSQLYFIAFLANQRNVSNSITYMYFHKYLL